MEKKFTVLRIIATLWKIVAWIALVLGVAASVGVLLIGVLGGPRAPHYFGLPEASWAYSVAGGIAGFVAMLIATIIYFLLMYAAGELIYLLLAIEENTRQSSQQLQWMAQEPPEPEAVYAPPLTPYSPPPPAPTPEE
jgi:heme/copper-type cytochrome/quinol oxidase subunit 1